MPESPLKILNDTNRPRILHERREQLSRGSQRPKGLVMGDDKTESGCTRHEMAKGMVGHHGPLAEKKILGVL